MKTKKNLLALTLVLALCAGVFSGCSSNAPDETDEDTVTTSSTEATEEIAVSADIIGEVTYVGTAYLSLSSYEAPEEVTDYAALDVSTLTEVGTTQYVYPSDDAQYYTVSDGTLVEASYVDIVKDCIIAVTTGDSGAQQIIILQTAQEDIPEDTATETTEETQTSAFLAAEVTAVNEDGSLTLLHYISTDDTAIDDYGAVDFTQFAPDETTSEYEIPDDSLIYLAENGELNELNADQIAVGDMLVIYTDDSGVTNIVVYPPETEVTE